MRVNTNVAALTAVDSLAKTTNKLQTSMERLSSGLRINKSADDASGLMLAGNIRAQYLGVGQAIRNANDAISVVQIADAALEESTNILEQVKVKATQAAQDGQTIESRRTIQDDVDKLLEELDMIARTTMFNGQKLLSGNFSNKRFQIGAYTGEVATVSIGSTESTKSGHTASSDLTFSDVGTAHLSIYSTLETQNIEIEAIELAYNNKRENSLGALADAINKSHGRLLMKAEAMVQSKTDNTVAAGEIAETDNFSINGVAIGAISVSSGDSTGSLVNAINSKKAQHGVMASTDENGKLFLTSTDGRAINVTAKSISFNDTTSGINKVIGGSDLTTLGKITLTQEGAARVILNDMGGGNALSVNGDSIELKGGATIEDASILTAGTKLLSGSTISHGSVTGQDLTVETTSGLIMQNSGKTLYDSTLKNNSVVKSGSIIVNGTDLGGVATIEGDLGLSDTETSKLAGNLTLASGTVIGIGSKLAIGTVFNTTSGVVTISEDIITTEYTLSGATALQESQYQSFSNTSVLKSGSILGVGSKIYASGTSGVELQGDMTVSKDEMTLKAGSILMSGMILKAGSNLGLDIETGTTGLTVTGSTGFTISAGSVLTSGSIVQNGSEIGGQLKIANDVTIKNGTSMVLGTGTILAQGTFIKTGTYLQNDIVATNGTTYKAGQTLTSDIIMAQAQTLTHTQILKAGSIVKANSILSVSDNMAATSAYKLDNNVVNRLSDLSVLTQESAQVAMAIADSSIKSISNSRAALGSFQQQLNATVNNLSTTQVNMQAAEATIMEVDFASEASNFSTLQILQQSGTFALAQAKNITQVMLTLLQ